MTTDTETSLWFEHSSGNPADRDPDAVRADLALIHTVPACVRRRLRRN